MSEQGKLQIDAERIKRVSEIAAELDGEFELPMSRCPQCRERYPEGFPFAKLGQLCLSCQRQERENEIRAFAERCERMEPAALRELAERVCRLQDAVSVLQQGGPFIC